jgi:hypothetical protein
MSAVVQAVLQAVLVGMAAGYLLRAFQTGSIFAGVVADLETGGLRELVKRYRNSASLLGVAGHVEELLLCPLCLAPYVAALLWLLILLLPPIGIVVAGVFASAQIAYWLRMHSSGS